MTFLKTNSSLLLSNHPCLVTLENSYKQESPPAWTQEAYRPPRGHSNFLLFRGGGGPLAKIFFQVWTCIKPNLVSKNFPFTRGGGPLDKNFFFQSEHVSSQIWCQKFFPFTETGTPPPPPLSKAGSAYRKIWHLRPPPPPFPIQGWISLSKNLRPDTPPLDVNRQTPVKTVPSRRTTYAGGKKINWHVSFDHRPSQLRN